MTMPEAVHARFDALAGHVPRDVVVSGERYTTQVCVECHQVWPCVDARYAAEVLAVWRQARDEGA